MSTRDLPHSFSELSYGWVKRIRAEFTVGKSKEQLLAEDYHSTTDEDSEVVTSVKANSLWPAFLEQDYFPMVMLIIPLVRCFLFEENLS